MGVRPSFVVRWCWFDRAMEVVVPTADGEANATTTAQGQVYATKMRARTPAVAATRYLPRIRRSKMIISASRLPPRPTTGQRLEDQDEKAGDEDKDNEDDEHDRTNASKLD